MAQNSRSSSSVLNLGMNLSGGLFRRNKLVLFLLGFIEFPFFSALVSGRDNSGVIVSYSKADN